MSGRLFAHEAEERLRLRGEGSWLAASGACADGAGVVAVSRPLQPDGAASLGSPLQNVQKPGSWFI